MAQNRFRHPLSGACACNAVRYTLSSAPLFVHCCHCTDCQRQTGTAFALNALIEADRVKLVRRSLGVGGSRGTTEDIALPTDSGLPHVVTRCVKCKTALWSIYGGRTQVRFIRVGTLDTPSALPPDVHIFTRSKLPWVSLGASARAGATNKSNPATGATTKKPAAVVKVYYDMAKLWPAASRKRRRTALAAV